MDRRESHAADVLILKARIERCFRTIETERMVGIPIINKALRVEVVGLHRCQDAWVCILITPWFMNVMMLPSTEERDPSAQAAMVGAVGSKTVVAFPAGQFEMIKAFEEGIGRYSMCSLFSPMHEFADHESAVLAAQAALASLLEADCEDDADADMVMIWRGERPMDRMQEPSQGTSGNGAVADEQPGGKPSGEHDAALDRRSLLLGRARVERRP
ncbi:MAG: [NiFe]-hydrogenase assembly chaperone HybE [Hyphomicrobiaceae bacterium]